MWRGKWSRFVVFEYAESPHLREASASVLDLRKLSDITAFQGRFLLCTQGALAMGGVSVQLYL